MELPKIKLKIPRRSSHPWIFQKMVEKPKDHLKNGSVVDIFSSEDEWVGRGFYNGHSRISLRVLTMDRAEEINEAFFERRLEQAIFLRKHLAKLDQDTDAYRLIHAEGDGLSGLIVDKFGSCLVMEFFSSGMYRFKPVIQEVLSRNFPGASFYWFAEEHIQKQESIDCRSPEPPNPFQITEHGLKFKVQPGSKHKTGFFVDQRENRLLFSKFCQNKNVLDICCNTGGFAIYAKAKGNAKQVTALDIDEEAIAMAKQNAELNDCKIKFVQVDLFHWLREAIERGLTYEVVILDPSKQTRNREEVETAVKRYIDMNKLAMKVVTKGGIFVSCSCTGLVSENDFSIALKKAAWIAGRELQIFKITGAGPDHPFLSHVPESRYLKVFWGRVF